MRDSNKWFSCHQIHLPPAGLQGLFTNLNVETVRAMINEADCYSEEYY